MATCFEKLADWELARQSELIAQQAPQCPHCGCRFGDSHQRDQKARHCKRIERPAAQN